MLMSTRGQNLVLKAFCFYAIPDGKPLRTFPGIALIVAALVGLSACASDIMKNYVGQPVESVVLDYGPPTTVVELSPGERAYQWRKISTNAVSGSSSGETRRTKHGTEYEVTETPGYVEQQECFYTFYAQSSGGRWFVTNFRKPKLECE